MTNYPLDLKYLLEECTFTPGVPQYETSAFYQESLREDSLPFLAIGHMEGSNLREILQDLTGWLRFKIVLQALSDVCEFLDFAHRNGFAHGAIALEKITFSQRTRRFKLAFPSPSPFLSNDDIGITAAEHMGRAVQKDLSDLEIIFTNLLSGVRVPWLEKILVNCRNLLFTNATGLFRAIVHREPERALLIVLSAQYDADAQIIHYDLDIGGSRYPEVLDLRVNHKTISDLCARCDYIGELALHRAEGKRDCALVSSDTQVIQKRDKEISEDVTHLVLDATVQSGLERYPQAALWIMYDPRLSAIPWELLKISGARFCQQFHVARSPRVATRVLHPGLRAEDKIRLLFIEDPDGNLEGARKECQRLREGIKSSPFADRIEDWTVNQYDDSLAIRGRMLRSDIIHFAGHGLFRETYTEDSGLSLGGDDIFSASQLKGFWRYGAPFLVFANACGSGRTSKEISRHRVYSDAATGLGQAFLAAGVTNYVGTLWNAPDGDTTIDFAVQFYLWFLSGCTVSLAIHEARNYCIKKYGEEDLTWARYILFGHPLNRIEI